LDNQRQYLQITPLQDSRGLDWLIVVAVPESDFMERINANTRATIILSLTALAIATLVGVMTSKWIIRPIFSLTLAAQRISKGHWDERIPVSRSDELGVLAESFNSMVKQLQESFANLEGKSQEIQKLNEQLEDRVAKRTAELNAKVEELMQTRGELLQSEKMASLGRLVAGFAHEINTPIGVAVGAASTLQETAQTIIKLFDQEEVDEEELVSALESVEEAAELTLSNLRRAIRLVSSFKRTAVDQSSEVGRFFDVRETIEDFNNSLHNKFKKTTIKIEINCPKGLTLFGLPGALDQILTNLMMNSFIHGFEEGHLEGYIFITARLKEDRLYLEYSDTGKGMVQETVEKIFEPFFTTRRGYGGSGLGMYICYNLVTSQLHGTISCESALGEGVTFRIEYPIQVT
jgi:signal transduction histidine kinase